MNSILSYEQKGCRKGARATKDQLLIDKVVLKEVKRFRKNVEMAYIDYRKAYDMVPHSWILEMMEVTGVAKNVGSLIRRSMSNWCTVLNSDGKNLGNVKIARGIFQGDSLSPLLFVLVMIPLTILLRKEMFGHRLTKDTSDNILNHLLFMDDLKLYGRNEEELERLVEIVHIYSKDVGMEFGLDKCGMLVIRKGVKVRSVGIELPDGEVIKELDEKGYKYLGILQSDTVMEKQMKGKVKGEYFRRLKLLLKSKLYSGNLIKAINAWAVAVTRYSAGVVGWAAKELKGIDITTRKRMTFAGALHMRSSVDRLYIKRGKGGRGLIGVEDCFRAEEGSLACYAKGSKEWLMRIVAKDVEEREDGKTYRKIVAGETEDCLSEKKLNEKKLGEMKEVETERNWQWLKSGFVSKSVEGFICAAQEQALTTRWLRAKIEKEDISEKCRICGKQMETIVHLVAGCEVLAKEGYKRRHDRVRLKVYWEVCRKYGIDYAEKWYNEAPDAVRISKDGKKEIWWDRKVETTVKLDYTRPDLVLFDREKEECIVADFSVPWDKNVLIKEQEKVAKYVPLAKNLTKV